MQIVIRGDAKQAYIQSMIKDNRYFSFINSNFADMLGKIEGQTIEVETEYLFVDQFNTVPIPGVSDLGMRIMNQSVERVIDDIRPFKMKCNWCGKTSDLGDTCEKCGKGEYLQKFKNFTLWTGKDI